jgi:hypothetical protein
MDGWLSTVEGFVDGLTEVDVKPTRLARYHRFEESPEAPEMAISFCLCLQACRYMMYDALLIWHSGLPRGASFRVAEDSY